MQMDAFLSILLAALLQISMCGEKKTATMVAHAASPIIGLWMCFSDQLRATFPSPPKDGWCPIVRFCLIVFYSLSWPQAAPFQDPQWKAFLGPTTHEHIWRWQRPNTGPCTHANPACALEDKENFFAFIAVFIGLSSAQMHSSLKMRAWLKCSTVEFGTFFKFCSRY